MKMIIKMYGVLLLLILTANAQRMTDVSEINDNESAIRTNTETYAEADISDEIVGSSSVKKTYGFDYFPLKTNILYRYDSNAGKTEAEVVPEGNELVLSYQAGSIKYEQKFFKGNEGIYLTRTESGAFLFFGTTVTYPKPVLRLPLPLEIGDVWEWEGLEIADGDTGKLTITGEALGEEVLKTPIGMYSCLKIRLMVKSENGSGNIITEWLAPEIGVVKFHADLEGKGITGFLQSLMGLDEITFDLTGFEDENT